MDQKILASNDYLSILQGEGGRIILETSFMLQGWLESNEYEYPPFDEMFEGMDGWMQDWGYNLGYSHNLPIFWHESEPEKRWTWPEHNTRDVRVVLQNGDDVELVPYKGQDIEVRGETVYYVCGCGEKSKLETAKDILIYGINCYGTCEDCGTRYRVKSEPIQFLGLS